MSKVKGDKEAQSLPCLLCGHFQDGKAFHPCSFRTTSNLTGRAEQYKKQEKDSPSIAWGTGRRGRSKSPEPLSGLTFLLSRGRKGRQERCDLLKVTQLVSGWPNCMVNEGLLQFPQLFSLTAVQGLGGAAWAKPATLAVSYEVSDA